MLKFFKLTTGDELVGELLDDDDYDLRRIGRPIRLVLTREGCGLARIPVNSLTIDKMHILYEGNADDGLLEDYGRYKAKVDGELAGLSLPDKRLVVPIP